ncbi:netrin receptor UNC5A-like [Mytilus californianus]|uniref:netrin receptor UNC5A-like n=1 Tax=Mytilus californianus TaxID=6549 RepID=UPI0022482A31|nr:netrin receptor UNC5A-like [Mytilus californianus]
MFNFPVRFIIMKLIPEAVVLLFLKVYSSDAGTSSIGSTTNLECPLSLIAYHWYKKFIGGTKLLNNGDKYNGTSNKTLTIKNFELTDEGFYRCEGFTTGGTYSMSHLIELSVAVDGGWSTWKTWDACTATCGTGQHRRRRYCNNPRPANGGASCQGGGYEYRSCSPSLCPVDTGWSAWDSWGVCNVTCGHGQHSRRRYCKNSYPTKSGAYCQGEEYDFNSCTLSSCSVLEEQQSTNIPIVVGTVSGVVVIGIVIILVVIYAKRRWYHSKKEPKYDITDITRVKSHIYEETHVNHMYQNDLQRDVIEVNVTENNRY